jgi:hypothetical protein
LISIVVFNERGFREGGGEVEEVVSMIGFLEFYLAQLFCCGEFNGKERIVKSVLIKRLFGLWR